jgi:hypothetical protein
MESQALRLLVRAKLADGRLPHDHIPRIWVVPAITSRATLRGDDLEGANDYGGYRLGWPRRAVPRHVFHLWDAERKMAGHEPSDTSQLTE